MRISIETKKTMTIFRSEFLNLRKQKKFNLIACGTPRGGTSIISTLMKLFEFELGDNTHPTVHEDMDFEGIEISSWDEIIKEKIAENPNWSVKIPIASKCLLTFEKYCPNPVFLIVLRNPFSVARSLVNHDPNFLNDANSYLKGLSNALEDYTIMNQTLSFLNSPYIIVEHEVIIKNPKQFVLDFIDALNIITENENIEKAISLISKPGYKRIT